MFGFVPEMMMVCGCVGVVMVHFIFFPIKTVDRRTTVDVWTTVDGRTVGGQTDG